MKADKQEKKTYTIDAKPFIKAWNEVEEFKNKHGHLPGDVDKMKFTNPPIEVRITRLENKYRMWRTEYNNLEKAVLYRLNRIECKLFPELYKEI